MTEKQLEKIAEAMSLERAYALTREYSLASDAIRREVIEHLVKEVRRLQARVKELEGVPSV